MRRKLNGIGGKKREKFGDGKGETRIKEETNT
jgi:hypothetical protein